MVVLYKRICLEEWMKSANSVPCGTPYEEDVAITDKFCMSCIKI